MTRHVLELQTGEAKEEDSGMARIMEAHSPDEPHLWVQVISWSEECKHPAMEEMVGGNWRVVIEKVE